MMLSVFGVIVFLFEFNEQGIKPLGVVGTDLRIRIVLYSIFAAICLFQLTTIIPFQFLLTTNLSLMLAVANGEYIGMKKS
jgi:hypothetical protein